MLIISICERIYQLEGLETKYPEHYLKQNRKGIDGLGAVLELLSLARTNRRRAIGWQPTGELMRIIANRKKGMRRKVARRKASPRNAYMVSLLFVAALEKLALKYGKKKLTGEETSLACSLSRDFLRELGLLSEDLLGMTWDQRICLTVLLRSVCNKRLDFQTRDERIPAAWQVFI